MELEPIQKRPLLQRPWFAGAYAFILSIPAGLILSNLVLFAISPPSSIDDLFIQISISLFASTLLLIPIIFIAPFYAILGSVVAAIFSLYYPQNLFRNLLILGTALTVALLIIFIL